MESAEVWEAGARTSTRILLAAEKAEMEVRIRVIRVSEASQAEHQ